MSAQAFVDESGRGSKYHVCVVVVANGDVDGLRRLVRSFCLPGQRRWHFVHERDSRRRQIIDALVASRQVTALIYHGRGRDTEVRAESFRRMVQPLLGRGITRLTIESREGRDEHDRQILVEQLRGRPDAFVYDHMPPHGDPLLWIADALAWCSSAAGVWLERIEAISTSQYVTPLRSAKPGRSPSGEEPDSLPEAHRHRLPQVYACRRAGSPERGLPSEA